MTPVAQLDLDDLFLLGMKAKPHFLAQNLGEKRGINKVSSKLVMCIDTQIPSGIFLLLVK